MPRQLSSALFAAADAIAEHTGTWITGTASMIAVGGLAMGLGIAEHVDASAHMALGSNIWFDVGVLVVLLGFGLTLLTLAVLVAQSSKARAFAALLSELEQEGQALYARRTNDETEIREWVDRTRGVIRSALGPAESALFLSDSGYVFYVSGKEPWRDWLSGRMRRLADLMSRLDRVHVDLAFKVRH